MAIEDLGVWGQQDLHEASHGLVSRSLMHPARIPELLSPSRMLKQAEEYFV